MPSDIVLPPWPSPSFCDGLLGRAGLVPVLIVAIGAQNTYVLRQGLRREHVALVVAVCIALDSVLVALGVSGLAAFLGHSPALMQTVALAGAAALVWYGWQALRRPAAACAAGPGAGPGQPLAGAGPGAGASACSIPMCTWIRCCSLAAWGAHQPGAQQALFWLGASCASALWFTGLWFWCALAGAGFAQPLAWRFARHAGGGHDGHAGLGPATGPLMPILPLAP